MNHPRASTQSPLTYLTARILADVGIPHFFSMKAAGNMADAAAAIKLAHEVMPGRALVTCRQVHGSNVLVIGAENSVSSREADALVTDNPEKVIAIRTADCVSLLIATIDGSVVAAVHAGWRGVVAGVVIRAIERMQSLSDRPLIAAMGPCISRAAFEVGPEVVEEFRKAFGAETDHLVTAGRADRSHIDLVSAIRSQVRSCRIDVDTSAASCTVADADRFHSYRRDAALSGRMLSGIGVR